MPQSAGLVFTNDSGAGSGTSSYVSDTLPDYTFAASNNTGFSSSISNNPLGNSYGNTDLPQYGAKYLQIKDLLFVNDRSQWIQGKTTYKIIFYENFPQIQAYAFGNVEIQRNGGQASVLVKTIGDGVSVNGVIRQVAFILQPNTAATATAQVVVDGSNEATTIDFSSYTSSAIANGAPTNVFNAYVHNSTMENYNIHDVRMTANQSNTLSVNGFVVYFQGPNSVIDQLPGTSYVNKVKSTTSSGVSLAIPSFGSSLGGVALVYKTQLAGYTISALSATTIATTASGSSGTNLLNLSAGTGASLNAGYGVIVSQGSSTYIGSIVSMSTDTATMGNTIGFGISATSNIYTAWKSGSTLSINASLMTRSYVLDFTRINSTNGFSQTIFDTQGQWSFWGNNIGLTQIDGNQCAVFLGASGFMQMDGYFSACEMETIGNAIFSATLSINGFASWSQQAGQTGTVKKTIFTDAGPGWNSFNIGCGASMGLAGIQRINLYRRSRDLSVSYGFLADFDIAQTYTNRDAINASFMALGGIRRVYADQLYFKNTWNRGQTWSVPGGVYYTGASTNGSLTFQYYGTNFGIVGTLSAGSTLTLDGIGYTLTQNQMNSVATLGFHTISYTGGTATISAIDYLNPNPYMSRVDANMPPVIQTAPFAPLAPTVQTFLGGSGTYITPQAPRPLYLRVKMSGGGGGGGGGTGGSPTSGGISSFGTTLLVANGGGSGGYNSAGGTGGLCNIYYPAVTVVNSPGGGGEGSMGLASGTSSGGTGGMNQLGGAARGGSAAEETAQSGGANTGAGGGGGGTGSQASSANGSGGGSGGYIEALIFNPSYQFTYGVGAGGAGGAAAGQTAAGGTGAIGIIIVEEYYQ